MKRMKRTANGATLREELDQAIEMIMANRNTVPPKVNPRIAALMRIAAELRELSQEDFKVKLKQELLSRVTPTKAEASEATRRKARPIPEGYHTATTRLVVRDGAQAIEFYQHAFGATELSRHQDPSGHIVHAEIMIGDTRLAIADEDPVYNRSPQSLGGSSTVIELYVEDVDAFANRAVAAGAKVISPIADWFYGDRGGRLQDPFGHLWSVSTHIEDVSPEEMNRRMEAYTKEHAQPSSKEAPPKAPPKDTLEVGIIGRPSSTAIAIHPMPEGFHSITPYLQVEGAEKLIEFLKNAFSAEEIFRVPRGKEIAHAQLKIENSMIEVADAIDKYKPNPTAIWLFVDDADAVYERALKVGATSLSEPTDQDYGERSASIIDPFGNYWYLATRFKDASPPPAGLHNVTPYLHPKGTAKVIEFMKDAFGAQEVERHQDDAGTIHHAKIRIGDSIIAMGEAHGPYQPMPPALHLYVPDTDLTYKRALRAGAISIDEPVDQGYGDRYAGVKDPFGNVWYIATHKQNVDLSQFEKV